MKNPISRWLGFTQEMVAETHDHNGKVCERWLITQSTKVITAFSMQCNRVMFYSGTGVGRWIPEAMIPIPPGGFVEITAPITEGQ